MDRLTQHRRRDEYDAGLGDAIAARGVLTMVDTDLGTGRQHTAAVDDRAADAAAARLAELHPYDTPAIVVWAAEATPDYAAWLAAETAL